MDFSLNCMRDHSEIINIESTYNQSYSNKFHLEELKNKEGITFTDCSSINNNRYIHKILSESNKNNQNLPKMSKMAILREQTKETIIEKNFRKNQLIIQRSKDFMEQLEDEEDQSPHKPNNREHSNDRREHIIKQKAYQDILQNKIVTEVQKELESWIQSNSVTETTKAAKTVKKEKCSNEMISVYRKSFNHKLSVDKTVRMGTRKIKNCKSLIFGEQRRDTQMTLKNSRKFSVFDKLSKCKRKAPRVNEERQKRESEEMKECSFKPKINVLSSLITSMKELEHGKKRKGTQLHFQI